MSLVVLIALAMVSLATVTSRTAGHSYYIDRARANARLALVEAIARLQQHAGQDQRTTARAEMFDSSSSAVNGSWIGVWNSSKRPDDLNSDIMTRDSLTGSLLDARTGQSQDVFFDNPLTWLVSGLAPVPGQTLIDPIVLRTTVADVAEVSAEKVKIVDGSGVETGSYAWFVDDLSMKANPGF